MKKLLSLLLALIMILSFAALAACSDSDTATDPKTDDSISDQKDETPSDDNSKDAAESKDDEIDLDNSLPNQYVPQKLAAGKEVLIGRADAQLNDAFNQQRMEGFKAACEDLGFTVSTTVCDGDMALQLQQVENFAEMGCAAIVVTVHSADFYNEMAEKLEERGTYLIMEGVTPEFYISGAVNVDNKASGSACVELASAWLDSAYPNAAEKSVHTAVMENTKTTEVKLRTAQLLDAGNRDSRIDIVYTEDDCNSLDGAYTAAESAMTYDPDIRLMLCFTTTHALGANNYVLSIPELDLNTFGIVCTGVDPDVYDLIDVAAEGGDSVIRGTIAQGFEHTWDGSMKVLDALLFSEEEVEKPYIVWDPLWAVTYLDYEYDTRG